MRNNENKHQSASGVRCIIPPPPLPYLLAALAQGDAVLTLGSLFVIT